jgi:hypothetical protein
MPPSLNVSINDLTITHGFALDQAGGVRVRMLGNP